MFPSKLESTHFLKIEYFVTLKYQVNLDSAINTYYYVGSTKHTMIS